MDLLVADVPGWFLLVVAFAFGATWGSFFNVAIYRWPRDMSVVTPPSHCPGCGQPVRARFNVPVLGYLFLRGKAACCGQPLSLRYPVVEALSGVLCVAVVRQFVLALPAESALLPAVLIALTYFFFTGGLLIATFVDLEHMEIPDEVSLPGAALGLATAAFRDPPGAVDAALGAGASYLVIQLVFVWSYEHLTGRRGMGEGDSKLLMMIGAFLGWQGAVFAVFAGAAQGLLAFLITRFTGLGQSAEPAHEAHEASEPPAETQGEQDDGEDDDEPPPNYWGHFKLPFGPFLALGALEYLFFGEVLVDAWFDLFAQVSGFGQF